MSQTLKNMRAFMLPQTYVNKAVDVGTVSTKVLDENPARKYAGFFNDSDTVIYLAFGGNASIGAGVRIPPDGFYEITWSNPITAPVYAVHGGTGSKRLAVVEAS